MTWNGSTCTGTRSSYFFDDGSGLAVCEGATSTTAGAANTATLDAVESTPGPFEAARACSQLTAYGHSDWYLPARQELDVLRGISSAGTINGFSTSDYWSSTEYGPTNCAAAPHLRFSTGVWAVNSKNFSGLFIRCVRK